MTSALFAYGTLAIAPVLRLIVGRDLAATAATLHDYERFTLHGQVYPGIVEAPGHRVTGCLYVAVDPAAWARLDAFEGSMYTRKPVTVMIGAGETLPAETYTLLPQYHYLLSTEPWDQTTFMTRHLPSFLRGCRDFVAELATRND